MKSHLYILTLALSWSISMAASETNTSTSAPTCCDNTNKCQAAVSVSRAASTNLTPEEAPWSYSTTGTDEKFKNLSSDLAKSSGNGPSLWRSAGATVFVLGLLFGVNYWLRKRGGRLTGAGRSERLRIVERVAVDHRRSILLIEVDGERIVASACADRIEPLAVLPTKPFQVEDVP